MSNSKLLVIFFFSFTTFASSFNTSNNIHKCPKEQSEALLLFRQNIFSINYTDDDFADGCTYGWPKMLHWDTDTDCCNWGGVTCDRSTGDVIGLDLTCGALKGTIDPNASLVNLRHLTSLFLQGNKLNGTLPSWLFTIPSLQYLRLDDNMFSGKLPFDVQTFRQLTNLTVLGLSNNNFSGELELDTLLSSLTNLESLDLSYSGFSVTTKNANHYVNPGFKYLHLASCKLKVFPNSFRAMQQLIQLDLSSNEIHGQIPHWAGEIGSNHSLVFLNLSHNFITGLPQFQ
ncbi:leucine-rich repeat-containing protein, partial [Tanacetum coccineum]